MASNPDEYVTELRSAKDFFDRSSACLTEADASFRPQDELMTVAQQVAHVAQTVDWFFEGAFRPEGFEMDFEKLSREVDEVGSLGAARQWLDEAFDRACARLGESSDADLDMLLPEDCIFGAIPRRVIVGAVLDHTAHHRGVLTVYSRLLGHVPAMPYPLSPA